MAIVDVHLDFNTQLNAKSLTLMLLMIILDPPERLLIVKVSLDIISGPLKIKCDQHHSYLYLCKKRCYFIRNAKNIVFQTHKDMQGKK